MVRRICASLAERSWPAIIEWKADTSTGWIAMDAATEARKLNEFKGTSLMKNETPAMRTDSRNHDETAVLGLGDYLQIARRRITLILITAMAVTVIVAIVVKRMPNIYRAETVILVDPQQVPGSMVPS